LLLARFIEPVTNVSVIDVRKFWSLPSQKMKDLRQHGRPTNY